MSGAATRVRPAVAARAVTSVEREIERRRAIRALLAEPLLVEERADPEDWAAIRRNVPELRAWFAEHTGWHLSVDVRIGVARLRKQPGWDDADATRPAIAPGHSRRPFDRRRYVLFCLACAELDRTPGAQTLLSTLAEQIKVRSATEGLNPFDAEAYAERFALVDALRLLERQGVLALNDGDEDRYVAGAGDALYRIDRDRLSRLVATPRVPSVATGIEELVRESYPDSREGRARRSRHVLMRRLLDDPVVYELELDAETRAYLRTQRAALAGWLRDAGLELERREEGAAAIDAGEDLADLPFPSTGTKAHATLLACELLAARGRAGHGLEETVTDEELAAFFAVLIEQHGRHWSGSVREAGPAALRDEVVERLTAFRLVRRVPGGVKPLPAVGRFRSPELNALADAQTQLGLAFGDEA